MQTLTIASQTFIQLLRMRIIWILICFSLILFATSLIDADPLTGFNESGTQSLVLLKNTGTGLMRILGIVFSITTTALLIPRDLEERILYTILSKSVPRWAYLTGKLLGSLGLLAALMLTMSLIMDGFLWFQTNEVLSHNALLMENAGLPAEEIKQFLASAKLQGPTLSFQLALVVIFLECTLLTSATLFLSSFSTSSLFGIISGFTLYFIGMFQGSARMAFSSPENTSIFHQIISKIFSLAIPDFQIYSAADLAINGSLFPLNIFTQLVGITTIQVIFYLALAIFTFQKREF